MPCFVELKRHTFLFFTMKIFFQVFVIVTGLGWGVAESVEHNEECVPPAYAPYLDVLFLIDRSSSKVIKSMPRLIKIVDEINNEYRRPRFALSFYSDFQCSNYFKYEICSSYRLEDNLLHHSEAEGCYTFNTSLSKDLKKLKEAACSIEQLPSGNDESGIAALMMAITDTNVKWTPGSANNVIIVVTDAATNYGPAWPQQTPPKGDGTDRCKTMDNPTIHFTGELLRKNSISLFLLLADSSSRQDTFKSWTDVVKGMGIKHFIGKMSDSNDKIVEQFNLFMNTCNS